MQLMFCFKNTRMVDIISMFESFCVPMAIHDSLDAVRDGETRSILKLLLVFTKSCLNDIESKI